MINYLILGDSIAVGVYHATILYFPKHQSISYAEDGITSLKFNERYPENFQANIVLISLGGNDWPNVNTKNELLKLRSRITANKIYWVVPSINKPLIIETVINIADQFADFKINIPYLQRDGIHPSTRGYKKIMEIIE